MFNFYDLPVRQAAPLGKSAIVKPVVFLLLLLLARAGTVAQPYKWDNVAVGGGGYITGLVAHPAEANLIYARTDAGGAYRYEAPNAEHPNHPKWVCISDWIPYGYGELYGVDGIAIDPNNTDVVYMALGSYEWTTYPDVYKSTDRGKNWTKTNLNKKFRGNKDGRWVGECIAVNPANSNVVLAGTRYDGLWQSNTGGGNWFKVTGIPNNATESSDPNTGIGVRSVVFDPANGQNVYATSWNYGVYRSTNGGTSWSLIPGSPTRPNQLRVSNGILYITATTGVFKFTNNTLTAITPQAGIEYNAIAVDGNQIVCIQNGQWFGNYIFRSANGGTNWEMITTKGTRQNNVPWYPNDWFAAAVSSAIINPFNKKEVLFGDWYQVWKIEDITAASPAYKSIPWGHEELVTFDIAAPPAKASLYIACADNGGLKSTDVKQYPTIKFGYQESTGIDFCEANPDYLVRVASDGWGASNHAVLKSTDGGLNWTRILTPGTTGRVSYSASNVNNFIYVPTGENVRVRYTKDAGATWYDSQGLPAGTFNAWFWDGYKEPSASDRKNGTKFYVFLNGTLYRSTNGGESFAAVVTGLPNGVGAYMPSVMLKASPFAEGDLWLSLKESGLYHFTNSGASYSKVAFFTDCLLVAVGPAVTGTTPAVYAYAKANNAWGLYRSDDNGSTWNRINDDQHQLSGSPMNMEADRQVAGRIYIGSGGRGIYMGEPGGTANVSPTASLTAPANNATFAAPANVTLSATAADPDGTVSKVEFYNGATKLGEDLTSPYGFAWSGVPAGTYSLTARAYDDKGASATSPVVTITVGAVTALRNPENPANTVNGLEYSYYEGTWSALPNFDALTAAKTGTVTNFDLTPRNRTDHFGFRYKGYISVPTDGDYTFYTSSDDGSRLLIGTTLVVDNDGLHGAQERSGVIGLKAGKHAITVVYFDQTGGEILTVSYQGPGIAKTTVPATALHRNGTTTPVAGFYRAINLNGAATTIDGNAWEGSTAANFSYQGSVFANQSATLSPATDANRATMIRSSVWGAAPSVTLSSVPAGTYDVYLYVWEDNYAETFNISLEGAVVKSNHNSGPAGSWSKLGPWRITPADGNIVLSTSGGSANLSGIEVWTVGSAGARSAFEKEELLPGNDLRVSPNPAADVLTIRVRARAAGEATVTLRNALSQEAIRSTAQRLGAGENVIQLNTTHLKPGLYLITLQKDGKSMTRRVSIVH
jgi:photosystem II stability/assembly factor-like uncharacterized protein